MYCTDVCLRPEFISCSTYHLFSLALSVQEGSNVAGTCLCMGKPVPFGQAEGSLIYTKTNQSADVGSGKITFYNNCAPQPRHSVFKCCLG